MLQRAAHIKNAAMSIIFLYDEKLRKREGDNYYVKQKSKRSYEHAQ